jgi:hypothetical protein
LWTPSPELGAKRDFLLRAGRTSMARSITVSSPFSTGFAAWVSFNAP